MYQSKTQQFICNPGAGVGIGILWGLPLCHVRLNIDIMSTIVFQQKNTVWLTAEKQVGFHANF